jgi:outer membrane lipoprotein carrier protein
VRFSAVLLLSLIFVSFGFAKKSNGSEFPILNQTTAKYRTAKLVQMSVEKLVKSELTGKATTYKGELSLSAGKFRMANTEPEKSLLVYDGITLWNEQAASPDFPGPPQVTKSKISGKDKSQTLFATLLTKEPVTKHFKVISEKKVGDQTVYNAEPLASDLTVKSLTVKIDNKTKQISEISYKDDIGNLTEMKFSNTQFRKSLEKNIFSYTPPKGASVTEI